VFSLTIELWKFFHVRSCQCDTHPFGFPLRRRLEGSWGGRGREERVGEVEGEDKEWEGLCATSYRLSAIGIF
jgi:hypothetical protein